MMSNGSTEPSEGVENVEEWADKPWGPIEVTTRDDIERSLVQDEGLRCSRVAARRLA